MPAKNGNAGGNRLVIVESPSKAKTIAGYLGRGYVVESSIGHIRDLPEKADDIPEKYKGESWARLGVNVDHEFEPLYVVNHDKKAQVSKLKQLLKDADELYLATDEDREGEAIAWHLREVLNPKVPVHRMVFHEITPRAIQEAVANPRDPEPAAGRRPGDPAHPRPPLRLRGQPGPVEEGQAPAVRRARAVRGDPAGRGARARAPGVHQRELLGPAGAARHRRRRDPARVHRHADRRGRQARRPGP